MRLRRFEVDGFAQFDHLEVTFRDDAPNLILGPNEAGKSHLMTALAAMFFDLPQADLYVPWYGSPDMRGRLELEVGGEIVVLERHLTSKAVTVTQGCAQPWTGKVKGTTPEAQRFAAQRETWLGVSDERLFRATTLVRQAEVIVQERKGITPQVKALITGTGETDYDMALKRLNGRLDDLVRLPKKHNDRKLEAARRKLAELDTEYRSAAAQHERVTALQRKLAEIKIAAERAAAEQETIDRRLEDAQYLMDAERELIRLEAQYDAARDTVTRLAGLEKRLSEAERERDRWTRYAGADAASLLQLENAVDAAESREKDLLNQAVRIDLRRLERLEGWVVQGRTNLAALPPRPEDDELAVLSDDAPPSNQSGGRIGLLLAAGIGVLGVVLGIAVQPVFFVLLLVAGIVAYLLRPRRNPTADERAQRRAEVLRRLGVETAAEALERREHWNEARRELTEAEADLTEALRAARVSDLNEAREILANHAAAIDVTRRARQERAGVLSKLKVDTVAEALDGLKEFAAAMQEVVVARKSIDVLGRPDEVRQQSQAAGRAMADQQLVVDALLRRDPALQTLDRNGRRSYFEELQDKHQVLDGEITRLKGQQESCERELWQESRNQADAPLLFNQIEQQREEIAGLERQVRALEVAIAVLGEAVDRFRDNCLGPVEADAGGLLRTITGGRYTAVSVGMDDLEPMVETAGRVVPAVLLSRGVTDQLYFSLRIALARAITRGRTLPLILDDPFVNFDAARLERVIALLNSLRGRTQVILFTCNEQYLRWLEPACVLDPPGSQTESRSTVA